MGPRASSGWWVMQNDVLVPPKSLYKARGGAVRLACGPSQHSPPGFSILCDACRAHAVRTRVRPSCASDPRRRALRRSCLLFVAACLRCSFSRACQELTRLLVPLSAPSAREMVLSPLAAPSHLCGVG
jgi:hypothetical protein